jgi:hypothetical protein
MLISTTGSVGTDKPLESMTDALGSFTATRVLLAIPPAEESYWLERGVLAKARALGAQVVVPAEPPGRFDGAERGAGGAARRAGEAETDSHRSAADARRP